MAASTAFSMPRRMAVGLLPAAMLRRPSRKIARASTVAVVVPSPAMSEVFEATSLTSLAPMFSKRSSSSISLLTDHAVLGDGRSAERLVEDHVPAGRPHA